MTKIFRKFKIPAIVSAVVLVFTFVVIWQVSHSGKNSRENFASVLPASLSGESAAADTFSNIPEVSAQDQISDNGEIIPLLWADNNDNENLIIKTDRKYYDISSQTTVYFGIANQTQSYQNTSIYFWFDDNKKSLAEVERIEGEQSSKFKVQSSNQFQIPDLPAGGPNRKDVKGYTQGSKFQDLLAAGGVNYYKAIIKSQAGIKQSEFFIEAIGDNGGYGHLDPFLASGLLGYWSFNGADVNWSSNTAYDRSGNNYNGTIISMSTTTSPAAGISGQALNFDGSDDYVNITNLTSNTFFQDATFTASAWIKTSSSSPGKVIISKGAADSTASGWLIRYRYGELEALTKYGSSDAVSRYSAGLVNDNQWHMVTAVFTTDTVTLANNDANIYIDGALSNGTLTRTRVPGFSADIPVLIGARPVYGNYFNGPIDEVQLYSRALSASEIKQFYQYGAARMKVNSPRTAAPDSSGLVAHWTFDGANTSWSSATGGTTADLSGTGNTATMTNMSRSTSPVPGISGQALKFDGVDDRIRDSSVNLSGTYAASVSLWMYQPNAFSNQRGVFTASDDLNGATGFSFSTTYSSDCPSNRLDLTEGYNASKWNTRCYTFPSANAWHHYVAIFDTSQTPAANEIQLYIDNVLQTGTAGYNVNDLTNPWTNAPFNIADDDFYDSISSNAIIDEVRVYSRALSASEIQQLYQAGAGRMEVNTSPPVIADSSGLVGYWSFNGANTNWSSATAGTVADLSGNNKTGTLTSMSRDTSPVPGVSGQGLKFDGSNDYITMGNNFIFTSSQTATLSVWFNINSFANRNYLIARNDTIFARQDYAISVANSTRISYSYDDYYDGPFYTNWTVPTIGTNTWHHIVMTLNTGGTVSAYYDGTFLSTQSGTHDNQGATQFNLGRSWVTANDGPFIYMNGLLDEVRVYNRILSADEIQQLYRAGARRVKPLN